MMKVVLARWRSGAGSKEWAGQLDEGNGAGERGATLCILGCKRLHKLENRLRVLVKAMQIRCAG